MMQALLINLFLAAAVATSSATGQGDVLNDYVDAAEAAGFTGGVLVARGDEILLERAAGRRVPGSDEPVRPDTVATTGSITKQFTAAAILQLVEAGDIDLDDSLSRYFADVPEDKAGITVHHLLSHQGGFPGAIGDDRERVGRDEFVRRAMAVPLDFDPGTAYEYSNVGFSLAAAILELVSGQRYEEYLRANLFEPAGMSDTGYVLPAWAPERLAHGATRDGENWGTVYERAIKDGGPGWHLLGNGGIHSTLGDMYRWHRALQGDEILSDESKALMYGRHADEGGGTWYGYGWSIEPTPWGEMVAHNGGNPYFFADYLRFPEGDVVIYLWTTSHDRRIKDMARPLAEILFAGESVSFPPEPAPLVGAGEGPPAAEGSLAAKWQLPGSHRGQRAAEMLEAITTDDATYRQKFIDKGFEPGLVERNGVDRLLGLFDRMRDDIGAFEVRGARPSPEGVEVVLESARGVVVIGLALEPEVPHRIKGVDVTIGD
ncbi:MAG: serine hydrolase domain-containing protein [Xanthomonadales bacterium]|nr:serine hydrolase domain-containing protein [Xanthomonadales bacterium]